MSKNVYKTANGQVVDMESLRLTNETTTAVGNMKVNARGDQILPDGTIVKTRNEVMREHYKPIEPIDKPNTKQKS